MKMWKKLWTYSWKSVAKQPLRSEISYGTYKDILVRGISDISS